MESAKNAVEITDYFRIALDQSFGLTLHVNAVSALIALALIALLFLVWRFVQNQSLADFEIDEAEFGLGDQKVKLRANDLDRTVAYRIWVELSTRKIGLEIDIEDDVIDEIYESWYQFFSVTRDLIKDVPVSKLRRSSTRKIVQLSIEVLNQGLRPHLTRWQARFRRWYAHQIKKDSEAAFHPQEIQKKFPDYQDLVNDMLDVNKKLIAYREKMFELVTQKR
ncbi:hypothetical protein [Mesorhizobium sp. Z1-4]|uniref:hypothetical protein n=1 Tax=Mesorhizobium sp. Z1-4 TaxID=2448478 RepID=UPI000FD85559|nr:hypothetical protein [Mesorhizobium sp. Z1-4]